MLIVYVDADACPVKDEVYKVAKRYSLQVKLVANSLIRGPSGDWCESVLVSGGFDAADDWIVEKIEPHDILISADIPLIDRCLQKGAWVLGPKGQRYSEESIADALAHRNIMESLRDQGQRTGGPAPFQPRDRSRFLSQLDNIIQAIKRLQRESAPAKPIAPPPPTRPNPANSGPAQTPNPGMDSPPQP